MPEVPEVPPASAAAAPPPPPAPPLLPPRTVGALVSAVPRAAAALPGRPPRAAAALPTAARLALAAVVLLLSGALLSGALLAGGRVDGVGHHIALVASGGMQWLLSALWVRQAGWRHPVLLGGLVALGLHEALDQASHAATSLLEVAAAARHGMGGSHCDAAPGP